MRARLRIILCLLAFLCFPMPVSAETDGADVVLIIDTSGSMNRTDGNRRVIESALLLIDEMELDNSRVGIVEFSSTVDYTAPLTPLNDTEAVNAIKSRIERFSYMGYTDIGLALKTAAEILLAEEETLNRPMIMLFTDGITEISPQHEARGRTVEGSNVDVLWALEELENRVPIHTIGLNPEGDMDTALLNMIAEYSTATATFTEDAESLPEIFSNIYRLHMEGTGEAETEIETEPEESPEVTPGPEPAPPAETPEPAPEDVSVIQGEISLWPRETETPAAEEPAAEPAPRRVNRVFLSAVLVFVVCIVALNVRWLLVILKRRPAGNISGWLDVRAITGDGGKTPPAAVELDLSRGRVGLTDIGVDIDGVYLEYSAAGLTVINKRGCEITNPRNTVLAQNRIIWRKNTKLTFAQKDAEDLAKVEITYRTEE